MADNNDEDFMGMQVKNFTKSQLIARIPELRLVVQAGAQFTLPQKAHMVQTMLLWESYIEGELEELANLIELVKVAKFQSEAFRSSLLWDLKGYAGATPEDRRKCKDRINRSLAGAAPTDPSLENVETLDVSGHELKVPARFKD